MFIFIFFLFITAPTLIAKAQNVESDITTACSQNSSGASSPLCTGFKEGSTSSEDPTLKLINTVINVFAYAAGILAFIYLIYGGFKYVTSAGNAEKAASGRQTIIYALIGIIIVVVAQRLVLFIISKL